MSTKLFGDTFRLSEFSSQRFLYGNFLPALYGVIVIGSLFLWIIPFTTEYLPVLGILSILGLVFAFLSHRSSRFVIFYVCQPMKRYKEYIDNEYDFQFLIASATEIREEKERTDIKETNREFILQEEITEVFLKDFRKHYDENFYSPPISQEMEEIDRQETVFLLGFWGAFWSILCLIASIAFYRNETMSIWLFSNELAINIFHFLTVFTILILICSFIGYQERKIIEERLFRALPLYIKPEDPVVIARREATKEMVKDYSEEGKEIELEIVKRGLEKEIHSYYWSEWNEKIERIRLEKELGQDVVERAEILKEFGRRVHLIEVEFLRLLKQKLPSKRQLTFGTDADGHIIELFLNEFGLESLPKSIYNFTELETLDLSKNRLLSLHETLGKLSQLKVLSLENNELSSLPETFNKLTQLKILRLDRNNFSKFPEMIAGLDHLKILSLNENNLIKLPDSIGKVQTLEELNLDQNQLSSLPKSIGELSQLKELSLRENELDSLPESIGKLRNLTKLRLRKNELDILPESIGKLTQLEHLSIAENQSLKPPMWIGKMKELRILSLDGIDLPENKIPDWVFGLNQLQNLSLSDNHLSEIPDSIKELDQLQTLSLQNNELSELPETLCEMKQLKRLHFKQNNLKRLPKCLKELTQLQVLDFKKNPDLKFKGSLWEGEEIINFFEKML